MEVRHPNLITILDMGFNDDGAYVVTEFIKSTSLREAIVRRGPLPYEVVRPLVEGAASALGALHQVGIVSGGLNPETIRAVWGPSGPEKLLISPLGLTSLLQVESLFQGPSGADAGLLEYISPEQRAGAEPDPRSDLFSLACIALEMLGEGPDKQATVAAKPEAAWPQEPPTRAWKGESVRWTPSEKLEPERRRFFLRATEPDPAARFADTASFLEALPRP